MPEMKALQPQYFERFRCIGADCEDTCCEGWGVVVDQETYEKYKTSSAERVRDEPLSSLVEINLNSVSSSDYAKMRLVGTKCCALSEGLCSIQQSLGEPYLSDMCSSFPRVFNRTGEVVERSLHLSCPEAARLALLDPEAMAIVQRSEQELTARTGSVSLVGDERVSQLQEQMREVRELLMGAIRERSRPLWQRVAFVGLVIEDIARDPERPGASIARDHLTSLGQGSLDEALNGQASAPSLQFEAVVELIVARFGDEYTSPRFLECYGEFMRGLGWTGESSMEELAERYQRAWQSYFTPFVQQHEHLLENYLLNYMFRTLFPYGRKQPDLKYTLDSSGDSIRSAYLLFAAHYAIIRTILIGMAAQHRQNLSVDHAVRLAQSCTKAFQHNNSYAAFVLRYLTEHAEDPMRDVVVLFRD